MNNAFAVYGFLVMLICGIIIHILWLVCLQICKNKGIILNNVIRFLFSLVIIILFFAGYFLASLMEFRLYLLLGCISGMAICHIGFTWLRAKEKRIFRKRKNKYSANTSVIEQNNQKKDNAAAVEKTPQQQG